MSTGAKEKTPLPTKNEVAHGEVKAAVCILTKWLKEECESGRLVMHWSTYLKIRQHLQEALKVLEGETND